MSSELDIIGLIRRERVRQGISCLAMAKAIGVSRTTYWRVEGRKVDMGVKYLERACNVLGVKVKVVREELILK